MTTKLPNLIIAGVIKGGTTSLYSYLSNHPDICCSTVKETCYFHTYRYGKPNSRYQQSTNPFVQYQQFFAHCQDQAYIMEATPGYFEGGRALAGEIQKQLGERVKIIIVLREPINRLTSFFKFKKSMLELSEDLTFEQYIHQCESLPISEKVKQENNIYWGIDGGFYSNYLEEWFAVFGDSLKVLFFEHLASKPRMVLSDICTWLSIDESIFNSYVFSVENKTVGYKYKSLQKLALSVNAKAEQTFRANPKVKKILRAMYYSVNGASRREEISQSTTDYLKTVYAPYNKLLAKQLSSRGYIALPDWLVDVL